MIVIQLLLVSANLSHNLGSFICFLCEKLKINHFRAKWPMKPALISGFCVRAKRLLERILMMSISSLYI